MTRKMQVAQVVLASVSIVFVPTAAIQAVLLFKNGRETSGFLALALMGLMFVNFLLSSRKGVGWHHGISWMLLVFQGKAWAAAMFDPVQMSAWCQPAALMVAGLSFCLRAFQVHGTRNSSVFEGDVFRLWSVDMVRLTMVTFMYIVVGVARGQTMQAGQQLGQGWLLTSVVLMWPVFAFLLKFDFIKQLPNTSVLTELRFIMIFIACSVGSNFVAMDFNGFGWVVYAAAVTVYWDLCRIEGAPLKNPAILLKDVATALASCAAGLLCAVIAAPGLAVHDSFLMFGMLCLVLSYTIVSRLTPR